jgi:hypothetical protein
MLQWRYEALSGYCTRTGAAQRLPQFCIAPVDPASEPIVKGNTDVI